MNCMKPAALAAGEQIAAEEGIQGHDSDSDAYLALQTQGTKAAAIQKNSTMKPRLTRHCSASG